MKVPCLTSRQYDVAVQRVGASEFHRICQSAHNAHARWVSATAAAATQRLSEQERAVRVQARVAASEQLKNAIETLKNLI